MAQAGLEGGRRAVWLGALKRGAAGGYTMTESVSEAHAAGGHRLGFQTLDRELPRVPLPVEGTFPAWLAGALLRTGPAKSEVGGSEIARARMPQHIPLGFSRGLFSGKVI